MIERLPSQKSLAMPWVTWRPILSSRQCWLCNWISIRTPFGLTAAQAGTLFLVVGLSVAFPESGAWGVIAGPAPAVSGAKSGPGCFGRALPFGVICVLTFTTPNISQEPNLSMHG